MSSSSKAQAKTMRAIAHGWQAPKGSPVAKIPKKVAKEFAAVDAGTGIIRSKGKPAAKGTGRGLLGK